MIDASQHVGIICRNIELSVEFYERLGLKLSKRIDEFRQNRIAKAFKQPQAYLTVAYLAPPQANGAMFIDVVQWLEPEGTGKSYPVLNHVEINRDQSAGLSRIGPRCDNGISPGNETSRLFE